MMRRATIALLVALACLFSAYVYAADAPAEGTVTTKYNMKFYGRVKIDLNYDTAAFERYNDFIGAVKADSATAPDSNDSTDFNPRDTRFGFEVTHGDGEWTGAGRFEIDFYGTNSVDNLIPRMRLGYVKMNHNPSNTSILVGQDWIPVAQLNPNTVDFGILTAAGNLWWRLPQVTVRHKMGGLELLVSAMHFRRQATNEEDRMPWVMGRVAYDLSMLGKGTYVALGGGYKRQSVNTTTGLATDGTSVTQYLAAAELKLVLGSFSLRAEPWIGQGIGGEFLRYDLDINRHTGTTRDPEAIQSVGGFVDATYAVTPKLSVTAGYGIDDPKDEDLSGPTLLNNDRTFTKNTQTFVNAWYSVTKAIKVGAEFVRVETERDTDTNSGNRYTISTFYEF